MMDLEQRVYQLEKEMADLKRQLEERPNKHPLGDHKNGNYDVHQMACNAKNEMV